jgi:hypothetical protein
MHFPLQCIVYVYIKLGGQNGCARRTRNIESIAHGLREVILMDTWIHLLIQ